MRSLTAMACRFKRDEHSEYEHGIGVIASNSKDTLDVVIDQNGKVVPAPIWGFRVVVFDGSFTHVWEDTK